MGRPQTAVTILTERFPRRRESRAAVLDELRRRLAPDRTYSGGRILGTMVSAPHEIAAEVFAEFLDRNVGDPGICPATAELEQEAVAMLGELLHLPEAVGHIVSGGSEANMLGLWSARDRMRGRGNRVLVPETAHVCNEKAARMLGLELHRVPFNDRYVMDVDATRAAIDDRTIAIVAVAGSTDLGMIDPVPELSALALEHDLVLHVDAAFGGFVIPHLEAVGWPATPFDFALPGVTSMTIDPHKMGFAAQPAGGILFRESAHAEPICFDISYLAGGKTTQATLTGTRSGAAALSVWAIMKHLGQEGYREILAECLADTRFVQSAIAKLPGVECVAEPTMNILGIRPTSGTVAELAVAIRERGWAVSEFPGHLRLVMLPHVERSSWEAFLADLADVSAGFASSR